MTKLDKEIQEGLYDPIQLKDGMRYQGQDAQRKQYLAARRKETAHLSKIPKPKFKVGDRVYSWQNPNEPAEVNYIRLSEEIGYPHTYRLTLGYDNDGYSINSKWTNEGSLFRAKQKVYDLKMSKQKQFEKQCKAKAHEGKKLKGQQKLTSAVSTSKRLSEFAYDVDKLEVGKEYVIPGDNSAVFQGMQNNSYHFKVFSKYNREGKDVLIDPSAKWLVFDKKQSKHKKQPTHTQRTFDIKGIADSLRRQGIEPDLHDIAAEYDHSQSHSWNLKHIKDLLGLGGRRKQGDYEKMAEEFYRAQTIGSRQGWLANASPQERAAAFARMRETGTLRGYDISEKDLKRLYKEYVNYFNSGAIHGDRPLTYEDWKKGSQAHSLRSYDPKAGYGEHYPYHKTVRIIVDYDKHGKKIYYQGIDLAWKKRISEKIVKSLLKEGRAVFDEYQEGAVTMPEQYADPKQLPPTRWYEAMVKGIKKSSDVRNPYAIVKNIWAKLSPSKRAEIKAREAKGEQFKYDLPLPDDKPTTGTGTLRMVKPFKLAEVQVNLRVKDYLSALKSGIFSKMKRQDGTTALVARCKSPVKNVNIFVDKAGKI